MIKERPGRSPTSESVSQADINSYRFPNEIPEPRERDIWAMKNELEDQLIQAIDATRGGPFEIK